MASAQWQYVGPATERFEDVCFLDEQTGFAVGSNGVMLKTTNGGAEWVKQLTPLSDGNIRTYNPSRLTAIVFTSPTTGYAVGRAGEVPGLPDGGLIMKTADAGLSWQTQILGDIYFEDVYFANQTVGYAVGMYGIIFKTTNGGTSWIKQESGTEESLYGVHFIDASIGYISATGGVILKTIDGGEHWTIQKTATNNFLLDVYFTDASKGVAVGNNGIILQTMNGGSSWETRSSGKAEFLCAVHFTDAQTGYAAGYTGIILKTTDGGTNWTLQPSATTRTLCAFSFPTPSIGYTVGEFGTITKTSDSGVSWQSQSNELNTVWQDIFFTDASTGYGAGYTYATSEGRILKTTNGGLSWTTLLTTPGQQIYSVYFADQNTGYAVGGRGPIWKTSDGGKTWTSQAWPNSNINASLYRVYFTSPTIGYATGRTGIILKTTNGGATWVNKGTNTNLPTGSLLGIHFPSASIGYTCGSGDAIFKTVNAGENWTRVYYTGVLNSLNDIYFTDVNTGYALGHDGIILKTTNGGSSWNAQSSGTKETLTSVHFTNASIGYATGANGTLLRTVDAGATWVNQHEGSGNDYRNVYFATPAAGYTVGGFGILKYVPTLTISPSYLFFIAAGESKTCQVTSNTSWTASSSHSWLTISASQGNGNGTLTITAAANLTAVDRTATITVNEGSIARTLIVKQAALGPIYLSVTPTDLSFQDEGESKTLTISSNGVWTITTDQHWWTGFNQVSGSGDTTIIVKAFHNEMAYKREGTITVKSGNLTQIVTISQQAADVKITLSDTELLFGYEQETKPIKISTNADLRVTSDQEWLLINGYAQVGSNILYFDWDISVLANPKGYARTGTITVVDQVNFSVTKIKVTQAAAPPVLSVSKYSLYYSDRPGIDSILVSSNAQWTVWIEGMAETDMPWVFTDIISHEGDTTVKVYVEPNKSMDSRSCMLLISIDSDHMQSILITQAGIPAYLNISQGPVAVSATGGSRTATLQSNTSWHVTTLPPWLSVSPTSGSGGAVLTITVSPNSTMAARYGQITVSTDDETLSNTFTLTQQRFTVTPESVSFLPAGESKTLTLVSPNTNWTVTSSQPWVSISASSGTGNASLTLTTSANTSTSVRSATVTFSAGSVSRSVTVSQQAYASICTNTALSAYVVNPGNGGTTSGTTLYLNTVPGASSYTVEVSPMADFSASSLVKTTSSKMSTGTYYASFPELTANQKYFVRVKTNLADCYGPSRYFSTASIESYSYVSNPGNGATITGTALYLNTVPGATSYTVEISTGADFSITPASITTSSRLSTGTYYASFNNLAFGQKYYARVKTNLSANWGRVTYFNTATIESYSYVSNPGNGGTTSGTTLYLNTVPGASSYTVEVSPMADFSASSLVKTTSSKMSTGTYYASFPELIANQKYFVRVKTNLATNWGKTTSFTKEAPTARLAMEQGEISMEDETIKVYPNPFDNKLIIYTALKGSSQVTILDYLGKEICQQGIFSEGQEWELDVSALKLKPGLYFLQLRTSDGKQQIIKLIKQ